MEEQLEIIMSRLTIIENKLKKKEYDKTYRERNKEKLKEYDKNYREKNKEKLKEKINCQYCNKLILKKNIQAHYKSMSCRKFWDSSLLNSDNEE
tara:strand:+ start:2008 stop:2289 length:282 start_codon:yes stop_codon:yes gene_type:complete